jgi:hypothetical protein
MNRVCYYPKKKKFKQNFGGLRQKLSIKSDEFISPLEFLKFSELAPPGARYLGDL